MSRSRLLPALFVSLLPLVCSAQKPAPAAKTVSPSATTSAPSFSDQALVFEHYDTTYRMHADGTGERDVHVVVRVQSQGAAQQFGVLTLSYASANETPTIQLVRVHKPDGTTVDTPPADAMDMPAAVSREAPLYSDLKEKHLPVRSLSVGDTLEYEARFAIDKAEAPGQFWGAHHFTVPGSVIVLNETLTVEVPANKYVQVWSPNHKPTVSDHDGLRTYAWTVSQLIPPAKANADDDTAKSTTPKDPDEDADGRKLPSVAWTTFHSWAEVGDWYRSLALSQSQPNDALRARADELTKDAKTPEDQIRALYEFVSTKTRYIGIDFGVGRYQPHSAAEVLANQYGDCKDKDTLLEALLHAKGFTTAPALIGAGIAPVPDVPSPAVFNHVITTVELPTGRIWLDSTPSVSPYRYLVSQIRDQKALLVPASAPAELATTPAAAPWPFTANFTANATLDADGKLAGHIQATYHDDDEIVVRALAIGIAPAEWDRASQYISSMTGFGGATSATHFTNIDNFSVPITVTYDYAKHPYGDWDNLRIVPLFPALDLTTLGSDATQPQEDIQLGAPRTLVASSTIQLPDGYRVDPPDPIHVKTGFATFDKTYRFDGKQLTVERTVTVLKSKLPKSDWKQYQAFTKDASLESENWIQLIPPQKKLTAAVSKAPAETAKSIAVPTSPQSGTEPKITTILIPTSKPAPPPPSTAVIPDNASVADLMNLAQSLLRNGDMGGAKEALDKVKAKNATQENLWSMYGFVAVMERDDDEAVADFRKEIASHPDNSNAVGALASAQAHAGDSLGARQTLSHYLDQHQNVQLSLYLASLQNSAHDYNAALKTLQSAADQNPDDRHVLIQICNTLFLLKRNQEAAAAARTVINGTDDPELLNNAAYTLSETGIDLAAAEDASRRSISALEEKSATISAQEANNRTFAEAQLLVASWDTLGWILFREGKPEAAKPLVSATWRASLIAESADHLGQVDEALGQNDEALTAYTFASQALTANDTPDVRGHIHDSIARLKAAGAKASLPPGAANTQDLRTWSLVRPSGVSGWGTFRIEITTTGVTDAQLMSGQQTVAGIKPSILAMKFPELLPPGSKAHLLRSAVVSCSEASDKKCDVVLVPDGGLQIEQQ
jgi:transglutaminase-like putative cysteine protease/tetratricopeptide (TPR) repeat protein